MRTALITGASSGFGKEFAYQLAKQGYNLHLVARRQELLEEIKQDISKKYPVDIILSKKDLTVKKDISSLIDEVDKCDLMINCAGFGFMCDFSDDNVEREQNMIELNVTALQYLNKKIGEKMLKKGSGGIINLASISSFQPVPYFSVYAATKAFVLNYSLGINRELKKHGIHVMALCPGLSATGFYTEEQLLELKKKTFNLPIFMDAEIIVRKGLKAFSKGKSYYIPGIANKIVIKINELTPRCMGTPLTAAIFKYLKP